MGGGREGDLLASKADTAGGGGGVWGGGGGYSAYLH